MVYLKEFVFTLTTITIFIVAVELVLPNNSFKKYQNFVLSLIMLAVMISPIIKIFNSGSDIAKEIETVFDFSGSVKEPKKDSIYEDDSSKSFIINRLEENLRLLLASEFKDYKFKVDLDGKVDLDTYDIKVSKAVIKYKSTKKVDKVEKVVIGDEVEEEENLPIVNEIKELIAGEVKISEDNIKVIKE